MPEPNATHQEGPGNPPVTPPEGQQLPTTMEELNKLLQSEADKRVTSALQTAKAKWEAEFGAKLETEKAEAARLAKLSADQREKEIFERQKAELAQQQAEFQRQQLLSQTMLEMGKANLPVSFAKFLMADTAETVSENLAEFTKQWQEALQKAVDDRLKGTTPKAGGDKPASSNSFFDTIQNNKLRK